MPGLLCGRSAHLANRAHECNVSISSKLWPFCKTGDLILLLQRWAVYTAATMLKKYDKEYTALQEQMQKRASVDKCVAAIEEC